MEVFKTDQFEISCEDNMKLMARYPDNYFDLAVVDKIIFRKFNKQSRLMLKHQTASNFHNKLRLL